MFEGGSSKSASEREATGSDRERERTEAIEKAQQKQKHLKAQNLYLLVQ
jgi:hypothetical protein